MFLFRFYYLHDVIRVLSPDSTNFHFYLDMKPISFSTGIESQNKFGYISPSNFELLKMRKHVKALYKISTSNDFEVDKQEH